MANHFYPVGETELAWLGLSRVCLDPGNRGGASDESPARPGGNPARPNPLKLGTLGRKLKFERFLASPLAKFKKGFGAFGRLAEVC